MGGSVGTSIYFNVFNTKLKVKLPELVGEAAVKAGLPMKSVKPLVKSMVLANFATVASTVPGVNHKVLQASILARQWAFAESLKYVWYTTIPFGILGSKFYPKIAKMKKAYCVQLTSAHVRCNTEHQEIHDESPCRCKSAKNRIETAGS